MSKEIDIVEQLGELVRQPNVHFHYIDGKLACERAAAEITRLRGEVEKWRGIVRTVAWKDENGCVWNAFIETYDLREAAPGLEDAFQPG